MSPQPYYQDDAVTIYHGDCREILPDLETTALLVTDPPYGISLNNDWQNKAHRKRGSALNRASGGIENDDGSVDWVTICAAFADRVVFGFPYLHDPAATGWLVWDKEPGFKGRSLTSPVEMAYSTTWRGFRCHRLMWSGYLRETGSEAKYGHPTQKPERLMTAILAAHTHESVVDICMGSGTTLVAAKSLRIKGIGVEVDERYCEIAAKRMAQEVLAL